LGEVAHAEALEAAARMYAAARLAFVLIEPGSASGFGLVRIVRARLLEAGAAMLAPCPAAGPCPMRDPDWCDFACRVERTALHRRVKEAALNYEDEKFSYVALGKQPAALPEGRIIRRPQHAPGLIQLEVCRGANIESVRATRRDRDTFRAARKSSWGDPWPPASASR
jgi:ribosomal protein RSM22 (predicted rRNA methylase)